VVGVEHLRLKLRLPGGRRILEGIAFRQGERLGAGRPARVRLAYRLCVNEYAGVRSAQLVVEYLEAA
jgi:single-stranded-DNA-specific exonuclease